MKFKNMTIAALTSIIFFMKKIFALEESEGFDVPEEDAPFGINGGEKEGEGCYWGCAPYGDLCKESPDKCKCWCCNTCQDDAKKLRGSIVSSE
eukprot:1034527-Ditylum_brightwellii.AAC.1